MDAPLNAAPALANRLLEMFWSIVLNQPNAGDHLPAGAATMAIHWVHTLGVRGRCIASLGITIDKHVISTLASPGVV